MPWWQGAIYHGCLHYCMWRKWKHLYYPDQQMHNIRGGADKSLARHTSRCRRTDSIVLLEWGVYSCAKLQVFSCYRGWKEACQATRAISTTSRRELSSSFFFLQGKAPKENSRHSDRNIIGTCTIVCHRQKLICILTINFYILRTATCFDASVSSSGRIILLC